MKHQLIFPLTENIKYEYTKKRILEENSYLDSRHKRNDFK